jgi:hypothetical protein
MEPHNEVLCVDASGKTIERFPVHMSLKLEDVNDENIVWEDDDDDHFGAAIANISSWDHITL